MKRKLAGLLAALLLLAGCGKSAPVQQAEPKTAGQASAEEAEALTLYPAAANLPIGRELKLKAEVSPTGAALSWESDNETVAAVDGNGRVTAKAPGECTVTVSCGNKAAKCAVLVKEDCSTVIFASKPVKGDGETPPEPPTGGEPGETPIELPPEIDDVSKIPGSDEYIWVLSFEDDYSTLVTNEDIPLIVDVKIRFKVEKRGGKAPTGTYTGSFSGDADIDRDNFIKVMNQQLAGEGGKLTDYTENDEGLREAPITAELTLIDDRAYHEVLLVNVPAGQRTVTQQLPIPYSDLLPGTMMSLGQVSGAITISGTMTMEAMGQTITAPFGAADNSEAAYAILIYPSGEALLTFPGMEASGFQRSWVEGMLTKRPLI